MKNIFHDYRYCELASAGDTFFTKVCIFDAIPPKRGAIPQVDFGIVFSSLGFHTIPTAYAGIFNLLYCG